MHCLNLSNRLTLRAIILRGERPKNFVQLDYSVSLVLSVYCIRLVLTFVFVPHAVHNNCPRSHALCRLVSEHQTVPQSEFVFRNSTIRWECGAHLKLKFNSFFTSFEPF